MVRRSDGVSTFNFDLNNPRRKYDNVFTPNDRVIVMMKRLTWMRTMTGLLNSVPLITVWPRVVSMAASCSLKRLQYWTWDQYAPATQEMIRQALAASVADATNTDGGVTNVVLSILKNVVGWPESKVHIARIPDDWFKIAYKVAEQVDQRAEQADALAEQFYATLGAGGSIAGIASGSNVNGTLSSGSYAGVAISSTQASVATSIYNVGKGMSATDRDVVIALATGMQESQLTNLPGGDRDSVGVFQQRPSAGWGTVAQCMNVTYAATQFFTREMQIKNRTAMTETQVAQAVQRSAFPNAYQKWVAMGQAMVRAIGGLANRLGAPSTGGSVGTSTGEAFAKVGAQLVQTYPNIPYKQYGGTRLDIISKNPPPGLDCSSFVQAVYLRTLGALYDMPRRAASQAEWCKNNGMQKLTAQQAMNTAGALLFVGPTESAVHHVEVSLGNGNQTVGAHTWGTNASVVTYGSPSYFNFGYLIPRISYPGGVGGGSANDLAGALAASGNVQGSGQDPTVGSDLPGYNPQDPFDKLFGNASWAPETPQDNPNLDLAAALTGVRALLNDQPLLPYLKNLFNSTMRSYCSAPNGDLIAWFPDYYGLWGTAAKMVIEAIECQDFSVEWADDFFVTHQFTLAGQINYLDVNSGSVETVFATSNAGADIRAFTMGIATIDIPAIMYALFGVDATQQEALNFANYIYKRFGARPDYQQMDGLTGPKAEFFSALFMFMRQWAYQYNADVPLTFMPELWPGMLIQLPWADFQAYVTTVTHSFQFGAGGGFTTSVNIAAPARLPKSKTDRDNVLVGLPLAGDYKPGRGIGNIDPNIEDDVAPQKLVISQANNIPVSM